jgi:predicted RND superfamily exporter protein
VDWTLRHGRLLWAVALLLAIPASMRTVWLYAHLRSDLEELLPRQSPSVVALDEMKRRVGGQQYLGVVVDSGMPRDLPGAERFLDALAERVRAYPSWQVAQVRTGTQAERAFLDRHAAMYVDVEDLRTILARLEARRDYDVAKSTGALLDENEPPPSVDLDDLRARYEKRLDEGTGDTTGRYTNVDEHLTVMLVELAGYSSGAEAANRLIAHVRADVADLRATGRYPASMRIGYAGDAAISGEELSALVADVSRSSVVVIVAVVGAIILYFRWWRSVAVVGPPLLLATVYAFAIASLPPFGVRVVNSNTAFLGSIIVGNGINFGLILLSRYVEERRVGADVRAALERSVENARPGTLAAAGAAAVSYAALAITQFQGFRQFGLIGALGMLLAWGATFLLMPSLAQWLDTSERTRPRPVPDRARVSFWVARSIGKAPRVLLVASIVLTAIAAQQVSRFNVSDIESDFSRLRRRDTWSSGEGYWGARMNAVLGRYLTPLVFLADDPREARAVASELRERRTDPAFEDRIGEVRTIDDVLPPDQDAKLAVLDALRDDLTPTIRASLAPETARYLDRLLASSSEVTLGNLPPSFATGLREHDGTMGRVVLVFPKLAASWWNADEMASFVSEMRRIAADAAPRHPVRFAGAIPLSSDILQAVRHDGPIASLAAFVGVLLSVVLLLRAPSTILWVAGALVVGVAWMAGASRLLDVRINFANFIAFPITFGIGVDYAANVVSRYERDGRGDILGAVRSTGAAVALCSLTTIIGYSSLLMAENRALFLFGLLAVLGEVSCLTVALVSLPALVLSLRTRRGARGPAARPSPPLLSHPRGAPDAR